MSDTRHGNICGDLLFRQNGARFIYQALGCGSLSHGPSATEASTGGPRTAPTSAGAPRPSPKA